MREAFDISRFDEYKEDNRREVKKANGGLPVSLWDTINNHKKVNLNLLSDDDVQTYVVGERFDPDRTVLSLPFKKKQAIKTSDKKQAIKTQKNIAKIREFLQETGEATTNDIAEYLNLSPARIRVLLKGMDDIEAIGENRGRRYKIHQNNFRQSK